MCGLVGMAGDLEASDRNVFRDLLTVCQVRGRDSTGVININKQQAYGYVKGLGPPEYLFDRRSYTDNIETGTHAALIGHCRHKTSGAVTVQNAHPFDYEEEGIIGVHNGTLRSYHNLDGHTYQKVDSDVLYGHLAKNGPEETFNKIEGAWACVWWDDKAETLNFIRNDERPLYFCWSADRRKLFWASEIWMFGAAERKIDLWKGPKDDYNGKYIQLPVDTLWSFKLEPNAKKDSPTVTMKPAKKIERKKPTVNVSRGPAWNQGGNGSSGFVETALSIWNKRDSRTHQWDATHQKWRPICTYKEWKEKFAELKKNGGSVTNPFQALDDQLPAHLWPKQETLSLIQGGKSGTQNSTQKSTTPSSNGAATGTALTSTTSGEKSTTSQDLQTSCALARTNRRKLTAGLRNLQQGNGGLQSNNVSFRSVAGMAFITDEQTGSEYSEEQVQENTGGECSFCDEPIGDLTEIAEFFGKNKFICTHCTEPNPRSSAA